MNPEERFRRVYRRRVWLAGGALSGDGSRRATTVPVTAWLNDQAAIGMKSVLDLGCGDLEWVSGCEALVQGSMSYYGIDVVPELIAHHKRVFPWFRGEAKDLEEVVRVSSDVVMLKDVIMHLCTGAAETILHHVARGHWKRLLITTFPGANNRIRRGLQSGGAMAPFDVEATGLLPPASYYLPRPGGVYAVWEEKLSDDS